MLHSDLGIADRLLRSFVADRGRVASAEWAVMPAPGSSYWILYDQAGELACELRRRVPRRKTMICVQPAYVECPRFNLLIDVGAEVREIRHGPPGLYSECWFCLAPVDGTSDGLTIGRARPAVDA